MLEFSEIRDLVDPFDAESLTFPWRHPDPRVDDLQRAVMGIVAGASHASRGDTFDRILALATGTARRSARAKRALPPYMTEAWYCCAEPAPEHVACCAPDALPASDPGDLV